MLSFKKYMQRMDEIANVPTTGTTGNSKNDPTSNLISQLGKDKTVQDALAKGDLAGAQRRSDQLVQQDPAAILAARQKREAMLKLANMSVARLPQLQGAAVR